MLIAYTFEKASSRANETASPRGTSEPHRWCWARCGASPRCQSGAGCWRSAAGSGATRYPPLALWCRFREVSSPLNEGCIFLWRSLSQEDSKKSKRENKQHKNARLQRSEFCFVGGFWFWVFPLRYSNSFWQYHTKGLSSLCSPPLLRALPRPPSIGPAPSRHRCGSTTRRLARCSKSWLRWRWPRRGTSAGLVFFLTPGRDDGSSSDV